MADEQDKWLDRDAAERLLRGEPLEDVDPHARARPTGSPRRSARWPPGRLGDARADGRDPGRDLRRRPR